MQQKAHQVMDYETLSNCFVACFEHYKEDTTHTFVVHDLRNDFEELVAFLSRNASEGELHVSYNGINFDSQITQFILVHFNRMRNLGGCEIASLIYRKAQETIERQNNGEWPEFPENKLFIGQIDVYRIHHWDGAQRRSALKWIQFAMDWHNIQEMPIHHTTQLKTMEEINTTISYCQNDVKSTKNILHLSKIQINMRKSIASKYQIPCYSYSNTKIGSELLLKLYCEKTKKDKWKVKKSRTMRNQIAFKDIIFPYITFESPDFKGLLQKIKDKVISGTRGGFGYTHRFRGYEFEYKLGGLHQCIAPGIYESNDEYTIKDLDVASLYPSIAVVNKMYPAHLGPEFFDVYKNDIVDVRLAEKRKGADGDKAIIEGFKEAANASYGNSNSQYSWLYDPQYTMQTTMNGQLLISMLVEKLLLNLPDSQLLQTNTDGATLRIRREDADKYHEICKAWEGVSNLVLEFAEYSKMYIWDVNNYIAMYTSGKPKCKGRFEWEDLQAHKPTHLHKNKSHLIVPKAIFHYFVHNTPPETYLADNRNIFDYCAAARIKGEWEAMQTCVVGGEVLYEPLQSTVRYYISKQGCKIIKSNRSDGRKIQLESGKWMQVVYNQHVEKPWEEYGVDDSYYLEQVYKEIEKILPKKQEQIAMEFPQ